MKPEIAFYYPGPYWRDADWIKNLILFFDGVAMLIPEYMEDHGSFDDLPVVSSLKDYGLFHVIRPEDSIGVNETKTLAEALSDIIQSGRLDHLTDTTNMGESRSSFGSLSMSRLGYYGDEKLADSVFQLLKARKLADDSEDGVSIPMHSTVRALILVLLAQILRPKGTKMGLTLSPVTDQQMLVDALTEVVFNSNTSSLSIGEIVSFDMAMVGVDLGSVPIEEILDFRQQHHSQHRDYSLSVRRFARELSLMSPEERQATFDSRQQELSDMAHAIARLNRTVWKKKMSFGMSLAGATWNCVSGDPIGAIIAGAGAMFGLQPIQSAEVGVYSYIFTAPRKSGKQRFHSSL